MSWLLSFRKLRKRAPVVPTSLSRATEATWRTGSTAIRDKVVTIKDYSAGGSARGLCLVAIDLGRGAGRRITRRNPPARPRLTSNAETPATNPHAVLITVQKARPARDPPVNNLLGHDAI